MIDIQGNLTEIELYFEGVILSATTAKFRVRGNNEDTASVAEILSWLCAALRTSAHEGPSYSCVAFCSDSAAALPTFSILRKDLQPIHASQRVCWHPLFSRAVIAQGFPIPERNGQLGLEIALGVMMHLSGVNRIADVDEKILLVGTLTTLVPTALLGNKSVQWHLIVDPRQRRFSSQHAMPKSEFVRAFKSFGSDEFLHEMSTWRHFLGWCGDVKVTLGTDPSNGGTYPPTGYTGSPECLRRIDLSSLNGSIGSSGLGFFGGNLGGAWSVSSARQNPFANHVQRFESLLSTARRQLSIIYDTIEQRAWLVPVLSVILHMIHLRVKRDDQEVAIPYAEASWDGGRAAYETIMGSRELPIGPQDPKRAYELQDVVEDVWIALSNLPSKPASRPFYKPSLKTTLFGYEFMDVALRGPPIRLKRAAVANAGGWTRLTREIEIVLFCKGLGDLITPKHTESMACPFWRTVPKYKGYLCATVHCLRLLSERAGADGASHVLIPNGKWHCPDLLFEDCDCENAANCDRLQQLKSLHSRRQTPPKSLTHSGAAIFGKKSKGSAESRNAITMHDESSGTDSVDSMSPSVAPVDALPFNEDEDEVSVASGVTADYCEWTFTARHPRAHQLRKSVGIDNLRQRHHSERLS